MFWIITSFNGQSYTSMNFQANLRFIPVLHRSIGAVWNTTWPLGNSWWSDHQSTRGAIPKKTDVASPISISIYLAVYIYIYIHNIFAWIYIYIYVIHIYQIYSYMIYDIYIYTIKYIERCKDIQIYQKSNRLPWLLHRLNGLSVCREFDLSRSSRYDGSSSTTGSGLVQMNTST